jgi:hypothetical protein
VGLPRSLPYFFASLKVAITLAFIGAVISETVASNLGIGYLMRSASSTFRAARVCGTLGGRSDGSVHVCGGGAVRGPLHGMGRQGDAVVPKVSSGVTAEDR